MNAAGAFSFRGKIFLTFILLVAVNALMWALAVVTFHHFALLMGTATLAYTFGLRHAVDADHISAIDNVTRKLMQDGHRPLLVGLFFSLGHSTIVILLSAVIALTTARMQSHFPELTRVGGLIGTMVSAIFLLAIGGINLLVLRGVVGAFRRVKRGERCEQKNVDDALSELGIMGKIFRPAVRAVDKSWKMYGVGFLFGLGFDTATEVGLLGISAAAATQGLPIWSIMVFPLLFTAGMCLIDTADGVLMLGAYGWALVHPVRKLYYNMTITGMSVIIALLVGGIELLGIIGGQFDRHGLFWNAVGSLNDHFGMIGIIIIATFVMSWIASVGAYRFLGYEQYERPAGESAGQDGGIFARE